MLGQLDAFIEEKPPAGVPSMLLVPRGNEVRVDSPRSYLIASPRIRCLVHQEWFELIWDGQRLGPSCCLEGITP